MDKVSGEVDRLMSSSKVDRFMKDFTTQWLRLDNLRKVSPDFRLYPEFDTLLNQSMPKESIAFMKHLYEKDLPIQNIIDSDFLVVNNQLAKHYKIPGVSWTRIANHHELYKRTWWTSDSSRYYDDYCRWCLNNAD